MRGANYRADIAIDDITFKMGACSNPGETLLLKQLIVIVIIENYYGAFSQNVWLTRCMIFIY